MASFKGRGEKPIEWRVELDAPTIEEIEEKHSINLVNLEADPLIKLRNDPMKLVAVIYLICQEQIEKQGLDSKQFARQLPSPPDPMLDAVREAIIGFFPSGRASHVREVLTGYDEMGTKTDELMLAKMKKVLSDPETIERLRTMGEEECDRAIDDLFQMNSAHGT